MIFVAALFAVLYHLGVMQWVVRLFAVVMAWLMGTSGAESLNVAASLFLGQTEAPLTIRPYLPRLTNSELLTVMTAGMAHVSGGVMAAYFAYGVEPRHILTAVIMTAPGAILLSKMLVPETGVPETLGHVRPADDRPDANVLDAAARGTRDGLHLALNIAAMLIAFLGLIALVNLGLGKFGTSLQAIFGWILAPVAYLMGVPWQDCRGVGGLLGTRTVLNELIAFQELGKLNAEGAVWLVRSRSPASPSAGLPISARSVSSSAASVPWRLNAGTTWHGWAFVLFWPEHWPIFSPHVLPGYCYERQLQSILVRGGRDGSGHPVRRRGVASIALVLGSGLGSLVEGLSDSVTIPYARPASFSGAHRGRPRRATWSPEILTGRAHCLAGPVPLLRGPLAARRHLSHPGAPVAGRSHPDSHGGHRRHPGRSPAGQPGLPVGPSQPDRLQPPARPARRAPGHDAFPT